MVHPRPLLVLALALPLSTLACKRDRNEYSEPPASEDTWYSEAEPSSPTPTPREVCSHLASLIAAEIGNVDPGVQAATIDSCTVDMAQEQQLRGPTDWDLVSRCVLASRSDADIGRCDELYPGPNAGAQQQSGVGSREDEACVLMISLVLFESGNADAVSDAEIEQMLGDCSLAFEEDRKAMTGSEYDQMVDCILRAQSVAQIEQCA